MAANGGDLRDDCKFEEMLERDQLTLLLEAQKILGSSLSMEQVLETLIDQVIKVLGAERGFVVLRSSSSGELEFKTARAIDKATVDSEGFQVSKGVIERVLDTGQAVLTSDARQDSRFRDQISVGLYSLRSILCAPITYAQKVQGAIYTDHPMEAGVFESAQKELLVAIAGQAGQALENAALYEQLQRVHETSMEKARQELAETQSQLMESSKLAAVGQLAAGLAHEVNNPLGAISLNLSALKRKLTDEGVRKRLDLMSGAVKRCSETIDRLLRFAHPSEAVLRPLELGQLITEVLELLRFQLREAGIKVRLELDDTLVMGEVTQLSQVFLNLFLNAEAALRGRPEPTLSVSCRNGEVKVVDNGYGMSEQTKQRMFEPFFTTKPIGEGVGLGMSVSYRALTEHKVRVSVDSKPDVGTRFTLVFPGVDG